MLRVLRRSACHFVIEWYENPDVSKAGRRGNLGLYVYGKLDDLAVVKLVDLMRS